MQLSCYKSMYGGGLHVDAYENSSLVCGWKHSQRVLVLRLKTRHQPSKHHSHGVHPQDVRVQMLLWKPVSPLETHAPLPAHLAPGGPSHGRHLGTLLWTGSR